MAIAADAAVICNVVRIYNVIDDSSPVYKCKHLPWLSFLKINQKNFTSTLKNHGIITSENAVYFSHAYITYASYGLKINAYVYTLHWQSVPNPQYTIAKETLRNL